MDKETGHSFEIKGIEQDGKERVDLVIRSRHNLIEYAKYKNTDNRAFFKAHADDILIHVDKHGDKSFDKINPIYVNNLKKLREHNAKMHKVQDSNIRMLFGRVFSMFGDKGQVQGEPIKGRSYMEIQELKNDS